MDVRLLGPVECWRDGRAVPIQGRSARAVLAMLALEPGRLVSTDQLVDGLWGEGLPADPSAAIYVTVSRVRQTLGPDRDRLRRANHGYVLEAEPDEVDASRAEMALTRGRSLLRDDRWETARDVLEAGLAEWRHETPLAELADLPFAAAAARRLQKLHTELVEAANDACLSGHDPLRIVDRSEAVLRFDPWRERLVAQLMTALHRLGRQGEALAVYARLASALKAEFGAAPSPELMELQGGILRQSSSQESLPMWFKTALEDIDPPEHDTRLRCRLMLALGHAEHHAGLATWRQTLLKAGDLAETIGDPSLVSQAVLGGALGWSVEPGRPDDHRIRLMTFALERRDQLDDDLWVRLLGAYADELAFTAALDERLRVTDDAVRHARSSGQPQLVLKALNHRFNAIWAPQTLPIRRREAAEACRLAMEGDDLRDLIVAHGFAMAAATEAADIEEVDRHLGEFTALAAQLRLPVFEWGAHAHQVWRSIISGDLDRAEAALAQAWQFGRTHGRPEADLVHTTQRAALRWIQGRLGEDVEELTQLASDWPGIPALEAIRALALLQSDQAGAAHHRLQDAWVSGAIANTPADQGYLAGLVQWSEIAAASDDATIAPRLYSLLAPYADRLAYSGTAVYGPVAYSLGLLAEVSGDRDQAVLHFQEAHRMARNLGSPLFAELGQRKLDQFGEMYQPLTYMSDPGVVSVVPVSRNVFSPDRIIGQPP